MITLQLPADISIIQPNQAADRSTPSVVLVRPSGDSASGSIIVLMPDGLGLRDHVLDLGRRLSRRGHPVVIPDLFFRTGSRVTFTVAEIHDAIKAMEAVTESDMNLVIETVLEAIGTEFGRKSSSLTILGFCFGGRIALAVAGMLGDHTVNGVCMFYPNGVLDTHPGWTRSSAEFASGLRAPMMGFFGAADKYIPEHEAREIEKRLQAAPGSDRLFYLYPEVGHAFFDESHPNYDAAIAQDSWCRLLTFLETVG